MNLARLLLSLRDEVTFCKVTECEDLLELLEITNNVTECDLVYYRQLLFKKLCVFKTTFTI